MEHMAKCKFCGQQNIIIASEDMAEEEIAKAAILTCGCDEAMLFKNRYNNANYAKGNIKELFENDSQALTEFLNNVADQIANGVIKHVKVETTAGVKAEITLKGNKIKVTRIETDKQTLET